MWRTLIMALKALCRFCGCTNYRLDGHNFCEKHLWWEEKKEAEREQKRKAQRDWSKYTRSSDNYSTSRWRNLSRSFLSSHPYCEICGSPSEVVDHIVPHRGDDDLFWDRDNLQALCKLCHNNKTQREMNDRRRELMTHRGGI